MPVVTAKNLDKQGLQCLMADLIRIVPELADELAIVRPTVWHVGQPVFSAYSSSGYEDEVGEVLNVCRRHGTLVLALPPAANQLTVGFVGVDHQIISQIKADALAVFGDIRFVETAAEVVLLNGTAAPFARVFGPPDTDTARRVEVVAAWMHGRILCCDCRLDTEAYLGPGFDTMRFLPAASCPAISRIIAA